jgi:leucyl-tRNA synthetase
VLSPEHPWVRQALEHGLIENAEEARAYILLSSKKSDLERQKATKEKTGVCLRGISARNPASGASIPVYIADYVLAQYGTGAIMAVPAHDERDFAFARQFDIAIRPVVAKALVGVGPDAVKPDAESIFRRIVDAIIRDEDGNFYLIREDADHVHYAGGGVDEGEDPLDALRREVIEETGFTDFEIRREIFPSIAYTGFRHTKQKNQSSVGPAYEVVLKSIERVRSEVEDGRHELVCVRKEDMLETITWAHHRYLFERYLEGDTPFTEEGILHDSGEFSGLESAVARERMAEAFGVPKKTYRLRDWIVSRQRYWGVPIPIIHCTRCGEVPVLEKELPVKLPEVKDYLPEGTGKSPLAKANKWMNVKCPKCKGKAERETDTLDTFVDSSWYFQRYTDPRNKKAFADKKKMAAWLPVDLYSGGAEHTTMHLLYSRFWHKAMYDLKLVKDDEPYARRMNRSLIMGPDGQKMSKSKGNVIDPDEVVARLGADTVRMYLAFIGPYNEVSSYPWNPDGVVGVRRFIERVWKLQERMSLKPQEDVERLLHQSIKKLTEDVPQMKFNTAIAQLMMLLNAAEKHGITEKQYKVFLVLLAPFAPHVADELWSSLGNRSSVHAERWPKHDPRKLIAATITIAVQVNGRTRTQVSISSEASEEEARAAAETVAEQWIGEGEVVRAIYVPQRLINLVVRLQA